jgi:hypothetical protein
VGGGAEEEGGGEEEWRGEEEVSGGAMGQDLPGHRGSSEMVFNKIE